MVGDLLDRSANLDVLSPGAISGSQILLLGDTSSDAAANLAKYVKAIGPYLHRQEPSRFMKVTIGMALNLCIERNVSQSLRTERHS